jgi:hypothetical protein
VGGNRARLPDDGRCRRPHRRSGRARSVRAYYGRRAAAAGAGGGGLFGLAVAPGFKGVYFVDDTENTLGLLH